MKKLQDNVRAVVVKRQEVQLRDPVTRSLRVRCTAAPAPGPAPVGLPSTAHCPASGDHPPTSTRPPPTRTAIRAAAARRARGRRQEGPAARPGHPVLTGALHCCSRASPSTSRPTFNCPLPVPLPRLRRPPADLNAATTDKDCDPSGSRSSANGLLWRGQGPPT